MIFRVILHSSSKKTKWHTE